MSARAWVGAPSPVERVRHRPTEVPGAPPVRNQSLSCVRPLRLLQGQPGAMSLRTVPKKRGHQWLPRLPKGVWEQPGGCAEDEEEEEGSTQELTAAGAEARLDGDGVVGAPAKKPELNAIAWLRPC